MKIFGMNDLRDIINQLDKEEISMSKALEILNQKAEKAAGDAVEKFREKAIENYYGSDEDVDNQLRGLENPWKLGDKDYQHS